MPQMSQLLVKLNLSGTWLDGEIVVRNDQGIPQFQLLQQAFRVQKPNASVVITYYVFDIPFYQGFDLRNAPLEQRRKLVERVLEKKVFFNIKFRAAFVAPTAELVHSACKLGMEGILGKRADKPYVSGRSRDWIKLKCAERESFLICGYTNPKAIARNLVRFCWASVTMAAHCSTQATLARVLTQLRWLICCAHS